MDKTDNERTQFAAENLKQDLEKASSNLEKSQKGKRISVMAGGGIVVGIIYAVINRKGFVGAVGYGMMGMALGTGIAAITSAFSNNGTA